MVLERQRQPLRPAELPEPTPGPGQVQLAVRACGVCRTDLHILDGDLTEPKLPLVMGHQIVGTVRAAGKGAERFAPGDRVGVPWLGWTDGECRYCRSGRENLCDRARFTGYDIDGGYAEVAVADERFCFPIPEGYPDLQAAPLLCAGLIGYRALRLVGRGGADRLLRLRRRRPHPLPGRRPRRAAGLRLHPRWRRGDAGVRATAGRRVGWRPRQRRRRSSSTARSSSPRSGR